jgi:AcrR family transcriptional regulator
MRRAAREGNLSQATAGAEGAPGPAAGNGQDPAGAPARPGRPRDARAHQAIVDATLELLKTQGYAKLTIEAIAAKAGVGKTTIYRRWPSKGPLVIEAISGLIHLGPMVDTGQTAKDLTAFLRAVMSALGAPLIGTTIPGLTADMANDPEVAEPFRRYIIEPKRARLAAILDRAEARGELLGPADRELVLDMMVGPILWRALLTGGTLDAEVAERIVDKVVRGFGLDAGPLGARRGALGARGQA